MLRKSMINKRFLCRSFLFLCLIATVLISGCDSIHEDQPECRLYVQFKYDYNMEQTDAFRQSVDKVTLYVFDKEGKFLFAQTGEGAPLAQEGYRMDLDLSAGDYTLMAWAGVHDSYDLTIMTPGQTTIEEMRLKLRREQSLIIDREIDPLWYGEIKKVHITGSLEQVETINLIKDTNKIRLIFQGMTDDWQFDVDNYTYQVTDANGSLNYDNSLLNDETLIYRPYFKEQKNPSAAVVELNTMRLIHGRDMRLSVIENQSGKVVLTMDMIRLLELTEMEEYDWSAQEYLDRQSEYHIIFFFATDSWDEIEVSVNGSPEP